MYAMWQSMDTAPTEEYVLLVFQTSDVPWVCRTAIYTAEDNEYVWLDEDGHDLNSQLGDPIFWQELPARLDVEAPPPVQQELLQTVVNALHDTVRFSPERFNGRPYLRYTDMSISDLLSRLACRVDLSEFSKHNRVSSFHIKKFFENLGNLFNTPVI